MIFLFSLVIFSLIHPKMPRTVPPPIIVKSPCCDNNKYDDYLNQEREEDITYYKNLCSCPSDNCYRCTYFDQQLQWPCLDKVKSKMSTKIYNLSAIAYSGREYSIKNLFRYLEEYNALYFLDDKKLSEQIKQQLLKYHSQGYFWASSYYKVLFDEYLYTWNKLSYPEKNRLISSLTVRMSEKPSLFYRHLAEYSLKFNDGDIEEAVQLIYQMMNSKDIKKFDIVDQR